MKLSRNQLLALGIAAFVAVGVLVVLGNDAVRRGSLSVYSGGMLADIPVDDAMLENEEFAFGPGGIFSVNENAEAHLEAMRDANRAYKSSKVYYTGSVAAGLVGVWALVSWWRQRQSGALSAGREE